MQNLMEDLVKIVKDIDGLPSALECAAEDCENSDAEDLLWEARHDVEAASACLAEAIVLLSGGDPSTISDHDKNAIVDVKIREVEEAQTRAI